MEARRLLELLETDSLLYDGFHEQLELRVRGKLPQKMLQKPNGAVAIYARREPIVAYA